MTREEFRASSSKVRRVGNALMCAASVILIVSLSLIAANTTFGSSFGTFIRSKTSNEWMVGLLGGLVVSIPLGALLGATALPAIWFDRRNGKMCPNCKRSLTLRCLPAKVLESGCCPFCKAQVFSD
jgi:hypothetical protein